MRFERQPPLYTYLPQKGLPLVCVHFVWGGKISPIKEFQQKYSPYHSMVVFLVMQTFFLDRVCGFWKLSQFPRMQKILWNNIRSFERHASMFWKYFDWSQLFFCEKVRIFLVVSKWERWIYYSAPYVPNVQSNCFQMFSFFLKSWKPRFKVELPNIFWGVSLYSPTLGCKIMCG